MLVSRQDVPAADLKGLVAWLKANPDKALQGTSGVGSLGHLAGILFQKATGTSYQFIPYRGLGPAMQDLVAGRVDLMIDVPINSLPYVRDGKLKAYAILGEQRVTIAPEVPTADEAGVPEVHLQNWYSIYAPKGTPKDVVARLNAACVETLADQGLRDRLAGFGFVLPRARATEPGSARGAAAGGDRQVGADHQGCRHQARLIPVSPDASRLRRRKSEQFGRIVDEDQLAGLFVGHPVQHHVEQGDVVRHRLEILRMRPVRAPQQPRRRICSTSLCTSGSVSENGNVSWFEMRGDSFTQQRPVSRQRSMNLNPAPSMPLAGLTPPICSMTKFPG